MFTIIPIELSRLWRILMQVSRRIAVAGATGRAGRHVVDLLKAGGHEVVAMSRSSGAAVD
jgi:nucleoside-diphosphate-sugar epimerase